MGRELQKRKRRSSRAKVTMPTRRKKTLNPSSGVIARNWDKKETLSQNYTRFGLVAKLGKITGGTSSQTKSSSAPSENPLAHKPHSQGLLQISEVKVERDPSTGRILRVLRDENPLNDPLNQLSESDSEEMEDDGEEWGGIDVVNDRDRPLVVRELEREAARPTEARVRHQSEREVEWLKDLVQKHGEDLEVMARDRKLNPMQQTVADIRKRLKKARLLA